MPLGTVHGVKETALENGEWSELFRDTAIRTQHVARFYLVSINNNAPWPLAHSIPTHDREGNAQFASQPQCGKRVQVRPPIWCGTAIDCDRKIHVLQDCPVWSVRPARWASCAWRKAVQGQIIRANV